MRTLSLIVLFGSWPSFSGLLRALAPLIGEVLPRHLEAFITDLLTRISVAGRLIFPAWSLRADLEDQVEGRLCGEPAMRETGLLRNRFQTSPSDRSPQGGGMGLRDRVRDAHQ